MSPDSVSFYLLKAITNRNRNSNEQIKKKIHHFRQSVPRKLNKFMFYKRNIHHLNRGLEDFCGFFFVTHAPFSFTFFFPTPYPVLSVATICLHFVLLEKKKKVQSDSHLKKIAGLNADPVNHVEAADMNYVTAGLLTSTAAAK